MQEDMHYYGTYAMARAAGLAIKDARIIAYAAQYVDDSTANDSEVHEDGGMFETTATAHTNSQAISNAASDHTEQRKVWIPFHFFPGNEGETLSQKLVCLKDSALAREMVQNHIRHAVSVKDEYGLALMGIMAHVYADTFSHYGFSGVSSRNNRVDGNSFELDVNDPETKAYIMGKFSRFLRKYSPTFLIKNFRNFVSKGASAATGALGHGAVGTYPDRPFLRWRFNYKSGDTDSGWRNNQETFLEGCEKLFDAFCKFGDEAGITNRTRTFNEIKEAVSNVLSLEKDIEDRINGWRAAMESGALFDFEDGDPPHYFEYEWEQEKHDYEHLKNSCEMISKNVYKFHQAAIYHRDYTLKQLLPRHGIIVL